MTSTKYIGMDVHKESISIAVRNAAGKVVMECVIETKASTVLQFIDGLRGNVHVTFEEGTWAAWLHDLLKPHVTKLVVCDPRRNALLQEGNQNDRVDARKLAELLHNNQLRAVYHGDHGLRTLKELARSYLTITQDLTRVMSRVKAIYRSWAIPCAGKQVYAPRHRAEWLREINEPGVHRRAEFYISNSMRCDACANKCDGICWRRARSIRLGNNSAEFPRSVRSGRLSCSEFYRPRTGSAPSGSSGLIVVSASRPQQRGSPHCERTTANGKKKVEIRGLNRNHNHDVKNLFKGAAIVAATKPGPFAEFYAELVAKGMRPEMARLTLARKIATIVLIVWKRGVCFDAQHLKPQTA